MEPQRFCCSKQWLHENLYPFVYGLHVFLISLLLHRKALPGKHEEEDLAEIAGHSAEEIAAEEPAAAVDPAESEESAE